MNITYFYRAPSFFFSIEKVSRSFISEIEKTEQVENVYLPCENFTIWSVLKNLLYTYRHRNRKGINHITGDIHYCMIALIGCKTVLTIHDIGFVENESNILKRFLFWLLEIYLPVKIATRVICISESTKKSLLKYVSKKDILVIPNSVQSIFEYKEYMNNDIPVILHIGTTGNKNLSRIIKSLYGVKCCFRIIGRLNEKNLKELSINMINYSNDYDLSDQQILLEYQKCDIVSFPSLYEGFGMPILEAQAVGRAVLTSDISPMKEIAGGGAILVNPYDIDSIKKGFLSLIQDSNLRCNLINKGLKNVEKYNSKYVSDKYIQIYSLL